MRIKISAVFKIQIGVFASFYKLETRITGCADIWITKKILKKYFLQIASFSFRVIKGSEPKPRTSIVFLNDEKN